MRVTAQRLGVTSGQAKRTRTELLSSHLQTKASGERPRRRVNELLRATKAETGETSAELPEELEDLEDFDPYDSTHLFWEQIKQLGFAFRGIRREDVSDEELLKASEPILAILSRIQRRKEQTKVIKVQL